MPGGQGDPGANDVHLHHHEIIALLGQYGSGLVGLVIALESLGLPLPGETVLIAAALYAGSTGRLDIGAVVLAAALGATLGNFVGYGIGRTLGAPALARYGPRIGFDHRRVLLGQYLFRHYGGLVIVLGRFTPLLRAFAALLAGANRMPAGRFAVWTVVGSVLWTALMGYGAHALGKGMEHLAAPVGIALAAVAVVLLVGGILLIRRHERRWMEIAELDAAAWAAAHPPHVHHVRPLPGRPH
jgi:membrane protein DedA with SNARE-associated domain